jgi:hypothetical protein
VLFLRALMLTLLSRVGQLGGQSRHLLLKLTVGIGQSRGQLIEDAEGLLESFSV